MKAIKTEQKFGLLCTFYLLDDIIRNMTERLVVIMCEKKELSFSIFMLYSLADKWKMSPAKVYKILNSTGILDEYIIKCYDVLHTQGKEYLVEDITDYVREKGVNV